MAKVEINRWYGDEEQEPSDYEVVDDVEWSGESYSFDMTRVYRQISTGDLFYAEDVGCSCPSPFQDTEESDLTPIRRMQDWHDHVSERTVAEDPDEDYQYPRPTPTGSIDQAHHVTRKIMEILRSA